MNIPNLSFEVYEESPASPSESCAFDASRVTRNFWLRAAGREARYEFQKAMLGYSKVRSDAGRPYLSRQIPFGNPAAPDADLNPALTPAGLDGAPYLWCKSVPAGQPVPSVPNADPATGVATYKGYRFTCEFRSCPYRVCADNDPLLLAQTGPLKAGTGISAVADEGDALARGFANTRYVSRRREHAVRVEQIKMASLFFQGADGAALDLAVDKPQGLPQYMETVYYTHWELPLDAVPRAAIRACSNGVNAAVFDGFAVGTLYFSSTEERLYTAPLGPGLLADLTYKFMYLPNREKRTSFIGIEPVHRELGWNAIPAVIKPPVGNDLDYYPIVDRAGKPPFDYVDFSALFRPPQT